MRLISPTFTASSLYVTGVTFIYMCVCVCVNIYTYMYVCVHINMFVNFCTL